MARPQAPPQQYGPPPGFQPPPRKGAGLAIASLVLGIIALLLSWAALAGAELSVGPTISSDSDERVLHALG